MSKIQTEFTTHLGETSNQKDGEDRQKYLARLIKSADGLTDAQFKGLSKEAKIWVNEGTAAVDNGKPVAEFPDAKKDKADKSEKAETKKADDDAKPAKKTKVADKKTDDAKPAKKEKATKSEKPAKEPKTRIEKKPAGGKRTGASAVYRKVMIQHPEWDRHKVLEACNAKGHTMKASTALVVFYEAKGTIAVLAEMGMLTTAATAKLAKADAE